MIQQVGLNQGVRETVSKQKFGQTGSFLELFQEEQAKGMTAKQYLVTLAPNELSILQKESHLCEPINITKISEEGARNLLAEGDQSKYVDLNNDAVTEIGAGKNFVFPPPNSPQSVKDAWAKTTANMTPREKMQATFPFLCKQISANIHMMPDGTVKTISPWDPDWRNTLTGDTKDFCNIINQIIDELESSLKYKDPTQQKVTKWEQSVLRNFSKNLQEEDYSLSK